MTSFQALPIAAAVVILIAIFTIGLILARLYKRSTKELAFVRTGFGGQKVIMDGGSLVFPVLHEIIPINMNTLRLEVRRAAQGALITKDRMRVDVAAEFYVRVKPTEEAIADAAQTLGQRTLERERLKELVEGKFVDALRAVAAEMRMEELHEQRVDFVQKVQAAVSEDLLKNGLELESVSLTSLDQTDKEFFNPNNAFDAEGLTRLTEEIEARRKKRNDIEQDTQVAVEQKNLDAERQQLEISKEVEYARLGQHREIEVRRAEQAAQIATEQAAQKQAAEEAEIAAEREVEQARIRKEKSVKEEDITRERAIETADIQRQEAIQIAEQVKQIAVAVKSKEESEARAEADRARAHAVEAEEAVTTVRDTAAADRAKQIELIQARKQAERQAIGVTVAADAEKQAAEDQAEAVRTLATGKADEVKIGASADAESEKLRAEAAKLRYAVEAEGKRALNEAENLLDQEVIRMRVKLALIENLDRIVAESVKPLEAIDGIKIVQVDGLTAGAPGANGTAPGAAAGDANNLAEQAVSAALRYRGQAPLLDSLLKEIGMDAGSLSGLTASIVETPRPADAETPESAAPAKPNGGQEPGRA
ncbi:MAG: flotillin domain-containing protein [Myxococcota bacterium]|nr:flotillin domain-containing protein [Myxococcota bacterium]